MSTQAEHEREARENEAFFHLIFNFMFSRFNP